MAGEGGEVVRGTGADGAFDDAYGRLLAEFAGHVGEKEASYAPSRSVREEIVRCAWFGGHFPSEGLTTDDGRRLEVVSPGWWNVESGPDFARAEFLLEGEGRVLGDVEVHTLASGWYAHGHDRRPEYNDVVLHVVMWNDRSEPTVRACDGRAVAQLTLSRVVEDDLAELVELVEPDAEAPAADWPHVEGRYCGTAYREGRLDPAWLGVLLDAAGDHRLLMRAAAVGELWESRSREQLLYERIAEALGYKDNRMPFLQLAGLLPVETLRRYIPSDATAQEKATMLEAALFAAGGFLVGQDTASWDEPTRAYCAALAAALDELGPAAPAATLSRKHWHFGGVRPANYPTRRIAALARLYGDHLHEGLFIHFLRLLHGMPAPGRRRPEVALRKAMLGAFTALEHPYWSRRYTLGGKLLARPTALVGRDRALVIVVDVLLPMLLAYAQTEENAAFVGKLHALWQSIPARPDDAVTRRMGQVIFESPQKARAVVRTARRQQGLHQIYRDCCRTGVCERCVLYLAHRAGKNLAPR